MKQPKKDVLRDQLRLAADEIIRLRTREDERDDRDREMCAILSGQRDHLLDIPPPRWRWWLP